MTDMPQLPPQTTAAGSDSHFGAVGRGKHLGELQQLLGDGSGQRGSRKSGFYTYHLLLIFKNS